MTAATARDFRFAADASAEAHPKSWTDLLDQNFGNVVRLHPIHSSDFRAWFAPKFAEWLQQNFRSPEKVAEQFGVRVSTAWNWWNGDNRASGDIVAYAFLCFPEAVAWFLREWEAR